MLICSKKFLRTALLNFTFFKVTVMSGDVTRQGMTNGLPSVIYIIPGSSLCISKKGWLVSEWEENGEIYVYINDYISNI